MLERNQREECGGMLAIDWTELEGADYFVDMETSSYKRKRRRGEAFYIPKSDVYDEDYVLFLEGLEEFSESKFMEDEDDDPLYLAFLDNLKEHRNAYKCDVSVEYGVLSAILYEEDSDDTIPVKRKPPKSHGGTDSGVKKKVVMDNSNARNGHSDGAKGQTTKSRRDTCIFNKKNKLGKKWSSSQENSSAPNDFPDEHRRSSEVVAGLNRSKARNDHFDMFKGKTTTSHKGDCRRENGSLHVKGDQRSSSVYSSFGEQVPVEVDDTYKKFLDNLYVEAGVMIFKGGDRKKIIYESSDQPTTDDESEPPETDIRSSASPASTLKEVLPNPRPLKSPRRPPTTVSRPPTTDSRPPRPPSSTLEPSTLIPRPTTPPSREKASTSNSHLFSTSTCKNKEKSYERFSSFWKELHDSLRKPYKQKEYDDLMKQVSLRRPISMYRGSRSGGSERPGELGKSYLQYYPDLNDEIKKVESDRYKVLNLLRMFTVYLKKIPSGVPKPWLDDYTKTIMPGSKLHGSN